MFYCHQSASVIVRRLHCCSRSLTASSHKFLYQYHLHLWYFAFVGKGEGKFVNFMILNLGGLNFGIKTVKLMFFVKSLLLYSKTSSRQSEYIMRTRFPWTTSLPEKTVQIRKHIWLYHNVDLEKKKPITCIYFLRI